MTIIIVRGLLLLILCDADLDLMTRQFFTAEDRFILRRPFPASVREKSLRQCTFIYTSQSKLLIAEISSSLALLNTVLYTFLFRIDVGNALSYPSKSPTTERCY